MCSLIVLLLIHVTIIRKATADSEAPISTVVFQPKGTSCLICPLALDNDVKSVSWKLGERDIVRHGTPREHPIAHFDTNASSCNESNYSLKLSNVTKTLQQAGNFTCWKYSTLKATFQLRARPSVTVVKGDTTIQRQLRIIPGVNEELECRVNNAIPPFNITWLINGVNHKHYTENNQTDFTLTLDISRANEYTTITCLVSGDFIVKQLLHMQVILPTEEPSTFEEQEPTSLIPLYVLIPMLFIASMLTSFFLYYRIQGRRKDAIHIPHPPAQEHHRNVDNSEDTTEPLVYDDLEAAEEDRNQKAKECTSKASTKSDYETSLVVCLKTSGMFEYWSATYSKEEERDVKCFAKTLSGSATMNDARSFQNLAMELKSLQNHSCIVKLLCISVDELPYSIFYEQLECGSLRDFMMSQYQGARDTIKASVSNKEQDFLQGKMKAELQELMYFASNITKGMRFLSGQKFCHPALCLKKVLLSNNGQCKLYDICPLTMAMKKVDDLMKKSRPPIAWMAPETVFMQEYFQSSDTWGYAVLLWELFSFGEVPFARASTTEIEQKLREGFTMGQPLRCPGAVYGIMLSCWNNRKRERPNFSSISNKLKDMARKLEQRSPPNTPSGACHSRQEFGEKAVATAQDSYFVLEAELPGNEYV